MGRARNAALVAVGLLVAFFGLKLASRDDPAPNDADLIPADAPASGADDAYPVFLRLNAALSLTLQEREALGKQFGGNASDEPAVAGFIARSTRALTLFGELSRRAVFQDPKYRDPSTVGPYTPSPQFYSVVAAAQMISLQAESLLKKGRAPEALAQALLIVDVGRMFVRGHPQVMQWNGGMILIEIGATRALDIATSGRLDRARLLDAAARLSAASNAVAGLQDALRYEYVVQAYSLDHLDEIAAKGDGFRPVAIHSNPNNRLNRIYAAAAKVGCYIYLPHRTKALFADRYHLLLAEAAKPCLQALPPFELLPWKLRPNMLGLIRYDMEAPSYGRLSSRRCKATLRMTEAAVAAALQAYRLDHRRFPASVSELTPGYLAAAPVDPFSGAELIYSPGSGEVHSAAKDPDGKPL